MIKSANVASFPSREDCLLKMLESIRGQFDVVRIYWNGSDTSFLPDWVYCVNNEQDGDLTDLGKFRFLTGFGGKDEYYFTLDDDLIYPKNYSFEMVQAIQEHGCIVTHHGRKLIGKGRNYYSGHVLTRCLEKSLRDKVVDVGGTGVMAFDARYFRPLIWNDPRMKMADLVFAQAAAMGGKTIKVLAHPDNYFGYLNPKNTIHESEQHNQDRLIEVADHIYELNFNRVVNETF
jgi:hypothetical protein